MKVLEKRERGEDLGKEDNESFLLINFIGKSNI